MSTPDRHRFWGTRWGEIRPHRREPDGAFADFRAAKYDGLAEAAPLWITLLAGAAAAAGVINLVAILGFIELSRLPTHLILFSLLGLLLAGVRRWTVRRERFWRLATDVRMGAHSVLAIVTVPLVPSLTAMLVPGTDMSAIWITLLVTAWAGMAFDFAWEGLHNALLAWGCGGPFGAPALRAGLKVWIRRETDAEKSCIERVEFDPEHGRVTVWGVFDRPDELKAKLSRLDGVRKVKLVPPTGFEPVSPP